MYVPVCNRISKGRPTPVPNSPESTVESDVLVGSAPITYQAEKQSLARVLRNGALLATAIGCIYASSP